MSSIAVPGAAIRQWCTATVHSPTICSAGRRTSVSRVALMPPSIEFWMGTSAYSVVPWSTASIASGIVGQGTCSAAAATGSASRATCDHVPAGPR